jgi:predicted nucleotidyltransferase component of viral defense system
LQKINIKEWVDQNPDNHVFRKAVHIILSAIAGTSILQTSMIMKGGILLALSYNSPRFTTDIDFSTATKSLDIEEFQQALEASLISAVENLPYGIDCRVQSCKRQPKQGDTTYTSIQVSIGYAQKGSRAYKRLTAGNAANTIKIDYSLNEPVEEIDLFELEENSVIRTYSFEEMVAEKFRAILQQEKRNRFRRQDIYDLHYVLSDHPRRDDLSVKKLILERLCEKSRIRDLLVNNNSMSNPEIRRRSEEAYANLASEIEGDLPLFSEIYEMVETFYQSLPWNPKIGIETIDIG